MPLPQALKLMIRNKHRLPKPIPSKLWKVVTGDLVEIISGKHEGEQGIVKRVVRRKNSVVVEGKNLKHKHLKATMRGFPGKRIMVESKIHYSNVQLVDPETGKATKARYRRDANWDRVRVADGSKAIIPKPTDVPKRKRIFNSVTDTLPALALEQTYVEPDWSTVIAKAKEEQAAQQAAKLEVERIRFAKTGEVSGSAWRLNRDDASPAPWE